MKSPFKKVTVFCSGMKKVKPENTVEMFELVKRCKLNKKKIRQILLDFNLLNFFLKNI